MNKRATADAEEIWRTAYKEGIRKYAIGQSEHKTRLWTAGLAWYARNLRDELIDGMAYAHHLSTHISLILEIADQLEAGKVNARGGAAKLRAVVKGEPKQ